VIQVVECWCRPIFGKIKEVLKESKQCGKIGECARIRRKVASEKEEKATLRKAVTKWTNYCGVVGNLTSVDLEKMLDRGPAEIKSTRKWTNLIRLGLGFL
jgi:hypothetical protein